MATWYYRPGRAVHDTSFVGALSWRVEPSTHKRRSKCSNKSMHAPPSPPLVCYRRHMRLHIALDDALVAELDRRVGARQRSAFIAELIRRGLDDEQRWDDIEAALGKLGDTGHEWDDDPAEWVRRQRQGDSRRAG